MSNLSVQKCKKSINYLLLNSQYTNNYSKLNWKDLKFKMAFITLTLSAEQIHSDNWVKKYMLNNFLIEAKRIWDIHHYVWRAEKQGNGNIHFHILVNKFIPWQELRAIWNRIQKKHGYIERYRANMETYHSKGFTINMAQLGKWSYNNQIKAYKKGIKENWSNPNSTDIHSVMLVKNVAAYVTKYMTKNEQKNHIKIKRSEIGTVKRIVKNTHTLSATTMKFLYKEAQIGRLWGCSFELTNLKGGEEIIDSRLGDEIDRICKDSRTKHLNDQYVNIIFANIQVAIDNRCNTIVQLLSEFMCERFILKE